MFPIFYDIREENCMKREMIVIDNRSDEIKLVNQRQVFLYIKNGIQPLRLECGYDDKLVYVFYTSCNVLVNIPCFLVMPPSDAAGTAQSSP